MDFDYQPTLLGKLLKLRPLCLEDYLDLYSVASDPLIWEQHQVKDRFKEDKFQVFFQEAISASSSLTAIDLKHQRIVGSSRFHGLDLNKSEIEIGWTFLARSHWGGTYNKEMKQLMLAHAFKYIRSVIFLVDSENKRSQKAVEKIGGVRDGTKLDGFGQQSYLYRISNC